MNITSLTQSLSALSLDELISTEAETKAFFDTVNKLKHDLERRREEIKAQRLKELKAKTNYVEPRYNIRYEQSAKKGSCEFSSQAEAEELMKLLNKEYYYLHKLEWKGEGKYTIHPETSSDRCGDTIYTSTFKKARR